jgi:proteasome activator subunit 4
MNIACLQEEETICLATADFEDFVLQFLDRCFTLIESSSLEVTRLEREEDKRSKLENMAEEALSSTCTAVLMQTSSQIFKVRTHITFNIIYISAHQWI